VTYFLSVIMVFRAASWLGYALSRKFIFHIFIT